EGELQSRPAVLQLQLAERSVDGAGAEADLVSRGEPGESLLPVGVGADGQVEPGGQVDELRGVFRLPRVPRLFHRYVAVAHGAHSLLAAGPLCTGSLIRWRHGLGRPPVPRPRRPGAGGT